MMYAAFVAILIVALPVSGSLETLVHSRGESVSSPLLGFSHQDAIGEVGAFAGTMFSPTSVFHNPALLGGIHRSFHLSFWCFLCADE